MTFIYVGVLTSILLFLTCSSSGVYVLACGIFPVIALRTLKYFDMNEDQKKRYSIVLAILVGASFLGLFFHYKWEVVSNASYISISDMESLSLERVIKDALQVFGLFKKDTKKVLSFSGGMFCAKLVIIGSIYILSLMHLPKLIKAVLRAIINLPKDSDGNSMKDLTDTEVAMAELLAIAIMNACILLLTFSTPRYHLIGTVALMIVAGISMSTINFKRWFTIVSYVFICLASVIICLKSINNYKECCPKEVEEYILQECRERNGDYIVSLKATDWAETIRVYDSEIECITYNPDRGCFLDYDVYHPEKPREILLEKCILFCYQNDWKEYFPDGIDGYYYLDSVGNMDIYTNIE